MTKKTVFNILTGVLGNKEVCSHFIQHLLKDEKKTLCIVSKIVEYLASAVLAVFYQLSLLGSQIPYFGPISVPVHPSSPTLHHPLTCSLHLFLFLLMQPAPFLVFRLVFSIPELSGKTSWL